MKLQIFKITNQQETLYIIYYHNGSNFKKCFSFLVHDDKRKAIKVFNIYVYQNFLLFMFNGSHFFENSSYLIGELSSLKNLCEIQNFLKKNKKPNKN